VVEVLQIAEATGLSLRRLRYVLEHRVLPGAERASQGHRVTRHFTGFEAFGIASAALLLEGGLRRAAVARCIRTIVATPVPTRFPRGQSPLQHVYSLRGRARLEIGDGVNLRLSTEPDPALAAGCRKPADTGWLQIATGAAVGGAYSPMVMVTIDVGRLRDLVRKHET
jgi:hypothetical protein